MVDCGRDECQKKKKKLAWSQVISGPSGQDRCAKAKGRSLGWKQDLHLLCQELRLWKGMQRKLFQPNGGRSPLSLSALWASFWSSGPSPRSATVIEVTLRQHLMKKKNSPLSVSIFLDLKKKKKIKKNNRLFSNWIIYFGKQSILPSQTAMLNWLLCPACSGTALFRGGGEG